MANYDILINGLNLPSNEELGAIVKDLLLKKKPKEGDFSYREIIIALS